MMVALMIMSLTTITVGSNVTVENIDQGGEINPQGCDPLEWGEPGCPGGPLPCGWGGPCLLSNPGIGINAFEP